MGKNERDAEEYIQNLDWGKSYGEKHSINNSGGGVHKQYDDDCPKWNEQEKMRI